MLAKRRTQPGLNSRRGEICRTAARIFHDRGFDATSVADIARALRMTKAGLYHYFDSKEALLLEIMDFGLDNVRDEVIEPARGIRDPEKRLRAVVMNHARIITRSQGAVAHVFEEVPALPAAARKAVNQKLRAYYEFVRDTLGELEAAGRLRDVDLTVAAFTIIGMIISLPKWFRPGGRLTDEQAATEVANMALAGVMRPQSAARQKRAVVSITKRARVARRTRSAR